MFGWNEVREDGKKKKKRKIEEKIGEISISLEGERKEKNGGPGYFVSKPTKTSFIYFEVVFLKKLSLSTNKHFFLVVAVVCFCFRLFHYSSSFVLVSFMFLFSLSHFVFFLILFLFMTPLLLFSAFFYFFFFPYLSFLSFSLFCFYLSFILVFFFF